jgi:hypothetical protein
VVLGGHFGDGTPFGESDLVANAHLTYVNGLVYAGRICGYMLYALLKDNPLLERLSAEIDAALSTEHLTIQGLRHLKFLRAVLLETIRLYPIAGAAPRYATQSFEYGGCRIEAGSTVFVAITVPHFMPEIYTNPYTFDPERFMEPRNEHHYPGAFHPYGLGQHTCISINVVETVVMTTIIGLLSSVRLELDPPDYRIRTVIKPVPGPDAKFAFRVREQRAPVVVPHQENGSVFTSAVIEQHDGLQVKTDPHTYAPGETIIRQGDTADRFYVLLKGSVDILKAQPGQPERRVAVLTPSSYFGEIGLLRTIRRTATVRVAADSEPVKLLSLDWHTFMYLVSHYDLTSAEIMELVVEQQASSEAAVH